MSTQPGPATPTLQFPPAPERLLNSREVSGLHAEGILMAVCAVVSTTAGLLWAINSARVLDPASSAPHTMHYCCTGGVHVSNAIRIAKYADKPDRYLTLQAVVNGMGRLSF
jgi:hypothetical protein